MQRREFLKGMIATAGGVLSGGVLSACSKLSDRSAASLIHVPPGQSLARFPEKTELILLTDRPPQLETPLFYYREMLTPNEAFFVRWHFAGIPTSVDLNTFRLKVGGHVDTPLSLSVDELKKNFKPVEIVAVAQCSGNSRRFFQPPVPGGQWQNGAVGNARWTGVRLKDLLAKAGIGKDALEVSFAGLDEPPLSSMPKFVKSLGIDHALQDEVIVAYEMNGAPLPMVNGFPLRLVVPGYFATYWVKSLAEIAVRESQFKGFWMAKSYRIPKNEFAEETPEKLAKDLVPINRLNLRSIFVRPDPSDIVQAGKYTDIEGLAFDDGTGIEKVELQIVSGAKSAEDCNRFPWMQAKLEKNELGKYSWYRWHWRWHPLRPTEVTIRVRATNSKGQSQTDTQHWNKSGYMRNSIESIFVKVV